jgi:hypothetical protein
MTKCSESLPIFLTDEGIVGVMLPSGKYFENAPKFKSSPQNNGISAALLKQKLCGSGM